MKKIFASQTLTDPRPWRYVLFDPNCQAREAEQVTGGFAYDPRPQKLPVNRVLAEVRKRENTPEGWARILRCIAMNGHTLPGHLHWDYRDFIEASPEEIAHATRVLTRLVSLAKAEHQRQEEIRAWWERLIGDRYEYELVRRDELKPGDLAVSTHWGLRTVKTAKQYGNKGQTTHIMWTDTDQRYVPYGERYDSKGMIARVTPCGAENPEYPGEYTCTYPKGHGKIHELHSDIRDADHGAPASGAPASGAFWTVPPVEAIRANREAPEYTQPTPKLDPAKVGSLHVEGAEHVTEYGVRLTDPRSGHEMYRWTSWLGQPHTLESAQNDAAHVYRRDFTPTVVKRLVIRVAPQVVKA